MKILAVIADVYNRTHWFTDKEAWMLYRSVAFGETVGWTLLISAILYRQAHLPGDDIVVSFAGTIHGLFFMLYFIFVLVTARSMEWSSRRVVPALLAGMPPYTSLIFEQIMARHRKKYPPDITLPPGYDD